MSKSAEAFRTISEVADALDTPAHVLRFWESRFAQIKPVKRAGGRRYYRPADVALLGGIKKLLHEDGLTIRGVQKMLREQGVRHVAGIGGHDGHPDHDDTPPQTVDAAPPHSTSAQRDIAAPLDNRAAAAEEARTDHPEDNVNNQTPALRPDRTPLADRAPGAEARASLQRDRAAAQALTDPDERGAYPFEPPQDAGILPAAALLRAMTTYHAAQRRSELTEVYRRLQALHARREAAGHRSRP